jgi:hypothetical protein
MLVADGVFACREDGSTPTFIATEAPTRDELRGVITRVIARLETIAVRQAKREGVARGEVGDDGMDGLRQAAGGRGTFARIGDRGGREGDDDERGNGPLRLAPRGLVAEVGGFNLHAGVRVAANDRDGLERLCRYMARPAVASGRVTRLPDGNVAYRVKSPRSTGATHRVMTPMEFMARLSALVPPPRTPLVRYHGVVAPNSPWRVAVVPLPPVEVAVGCGRGGGAGGGGGWNGSQPERGGRRRAARAACARGGPSKSIARREARVNHLVARRVNPRATVGPGLATRGSQRMGSTHEACVREPWSRG